MSATDEIIAEDLVDEAIHANEPISVVNCFLLFLFIHMQ
jgi:hypothetical protein